MKSKITVERCRTYVIDAPLPEGVPKDPSLDPEVSDGAVGIERKGGHPYTVTAVHRRNGVVTKVEVRRNVVIQENGCSTFWHDEGSPSVTVVRRKNGRWVREGHNLTDLLGSFTFGSRKTCIPHRSIVVSDQQGQGDRSSS